MKKKTKVKPGVKVVNKKNLIIYNTNYILNQLKNRILQLFL